MATCCVKLAKSSNDVVVSLRIDPPLLGADDNGGICSLVEWIDWTTVAVAVLLCLSCCESFISESNAIVRGVAPSLIISLELLADVAAAAAAGGGANDRVGGGGNTVLEM